MAETKRTPKVEEFNIDQKVTVRSIAGWSVGFARIEGTGDVSLAPEGRTKLSRSEIIAQVQNGNKLFTGVDGMGSHATIYIDDMATRKELEFESEDGKTKQLFFSDDIAKRLFDIKSQDVFEKEFRETIKTRAEKYAVVKAIQKMGFSDYRKIMFITNYTGYKI